MALIHSAFLSLSYCQFIFLYETFYLRLRKTIYWFIRSLNIHVYVFMYVCMYVCMYVNVTIAK